MHRTLLPVLCCIAVLNALELPLDRLQAAAMLEGGELDSNLWQAVKPYYVEPVSVPDGELPALAQVLPELATVHLPSEEGELAAYEPWTPRQVQRFLLDYPYLAGVVPILSFASRAGKRECGWVSLRLRGKGARMASSQHVAALFEPHRVVRARVRMRRDGDSSWAARWRTLRIRLGRGGDIVTGDFRPRLDDGLLSGRFDRIVAASLRSPQRILFGSSRGYNGVLWRWGRRSRARGELFYHRDPSLRAFGGALSLRPITRIRLRAGVSGYVPVDHGDSIRVAARLGLTLGTRGCRAEVDCSVPVTGPFGAAVHANVSHRRNGSRLRLELVSVSGRYPARWGSVSAWIADDSGNPRGRTGARLRFDALLFERILLGPQVTYVCGRGASACRASLALSGHRPFEYRVAYYYSPALDASSVDRHTVRVRVGRSFGRVFGARLHGRWYVRRCAYWSLSARAVIVCRTVLGSWEPYVDMRRVDSGGNTYAAGLRQNVRIGDIATGMLTVESPLGREEDTREDIELRVAVRLAL